MATVISAFVTHVVFHPVISVRLDERKGSHGPVTLYHYDNQRKLIGTSQAKYFRLHVENTGLSTVRACSGYITKLTRRVGGQVTASEEEADTDRIEIPQRSSLLQCRGALSFRSKHGRTG
jgi:hypothetical protein